jgi:hypothetical protein
MKDHHTNTNMVAQSRDHRGMAYSSRKEVVTSRDLASVVHSLCIDDVLYSPIVILKMCAGLANKQYGRLVDGECNGIR